MEKQYIFLLIAILALALYFYQRGTYKMVVPNAHEIGTDDDYIPLVGGKPVSPLLTESVVYDFLDTIATLKGANGPEDVAFFDFNGKTTEQVAELLQKVTIDQLMASLKEIDDTDIKTDKFYQELVKNKTHQTGKPVKIDCSKCKWNQLLDSSNDNMKCKYKNMLCAPGICKDIDGQDPWIASGDPSIDLTSKWGCTGGEVLRKADGSYMDFVPS